MAIITIFGGTYCHMDEIVAGIADKLNYAILGEDLESETCKRFGIEKERISRTYTGSGGAFKRLFHTREKTTAMLRLVLAELKKTADQKMKSPTTPPR